MGQAKGFEQILDFGAERPDWLTVGCQVSTAGSTAVPMIDATCDSEVIRYGGLQVSPLLSLAHLLRCCLITTTIAQYLERQFCACQMRVKVHLHSKWSNNNINTVQQGSDLHTLRALTCIPL